MRAAPALLAALALAACATAPTNEGQALAAAQDAVAAALTGVHQAYLSGVINKAQVQAAAKLGDQADDDAKMARAAYAAGNAATAQGAVDQINALATQIVALEQPPKATP